MTSASQMLTRNVGKELFVLGNSLESPCNCPFVVSKKIQVLRSQLEKMRANDAEQILIVHGILTSAVSIPNQLPHGTNAFILIENANKAEDSFIIQLDSVEQVVRTIETLVNKKDFIGKVMADELDDSLFEVDKQQIENLFIMYGYVLKPTLYLPIDAVYTEKLKGAKKVFEIIREVQA